MKAYISGQITGLTEKEYKSNFANSIIWTWQNVKVCKCVSPLNITPFLGVKKWPFYMIADIIEQKKCDTTVMQPNWTQSKGAVIEYFLAKFIFKQKVIFMPSWEKKSKEN